MATDLYADTSAFQTFGGLYNSMIFGDFVAAGGDTEGRQFVSGNFNLSTTGYSVGYTVVGVPNAPQAGRDDLVIGGSFYGGTISTVTEDAVLGGAVVSGSIGFDAPNPQSSGQGTLTQNAGAFRLDTTTGNATGVTIGSISIADLHDAFRAESTALSSLSTSAGVTVTNLGYELNVHVTGAPGLKIINLTQAEWTAVSYADRRITVDPSAAGSTIVVNVGGATINLGGGTMTLTGVTQSHVLVNYHQATSWSSEFFLHEGSVLAAFTGTASIKGSINGSAVFAADVGSSVAKTNNAEFHNFLFTGTLPSAVPEPGTALLVVAGLGVLAARRRRVS